MSPGGRRARKCPGKAQPQRETVPYTGLCAVAVWRLAVCIPE